MLGGQGHIFAWRILGQIRGLWVAFAVVALVGCASPQTSPPTTRPSTSPARQDVDRLAAAILALGPDVDPGEAAQAARLAFSRSRELALAYQITDPPLVHNTKVNMGLKPRGLCWHWAEDMQQRLNAEGFATLRIHRAIANADNPFRIDHSTALIAARGDPMQDGIVLDPWRLGGRLFWAPVLDDADYDWQPRSRVLARRYGVAPVLSAQ